MDCGKSPSGVRKKNKKQVKDELDRIKQAEKKKRRLEKALATSAAIISELEKKKLKKKEEQQRLDEEGAAIAEAVALQVLVDEDSDESYSSQNSRASCFDLFVGGGDGHGARTGAAVPRLPYNRQHYRNPNEIGWIVNAHGGSRCQWNDYGCGNDGSFLKGVQAPYVDEISAQAVSALRIADDDDMNAFVINRMVR
uniref:uncharacterized protein LOC122587453 n=1 Tax=Erigeron canadensis TaxID=72917 RepID=UPI001CB94578|nr:uncharacterized protein LOC122587453 [Erigeron canadensis]